MDQPVNIPLKILYIGTDSQLIELFQKSNLFEVIQKDNGLAALSWLTDNSFDLFDINKDTQFQKTYKENQDIDAIIAEIVLPGINALTFYRKLKLYKFYQSKPYIILSLNRDNAIRLDAYSMGVDDFYHNVIDCEKIYSRILFLKKFKAEYIPKPLDFQDKEMTPYVTPLPKRVFDLAISFFALLILSPIMLLTVIAILLESSGKVYYISKRVGANYKIFDFYKFRSMYPNADTRVKDFAHLNQYIGESVEEVCSECAKLPSNQTCSPLVYYDGEQICERLANKRHNAKKAFLKIKNDPRITKVGKFIRMSSIDELPQLFNIIKGDMSIVGNRPLPLNEAEALTKKKWSRRFRAAAGLTGLWQVEKRGRKGTMSEEERFALDNYYAEHNSFWGDFKIILRTVTVFIQKENV
ncbi:MAG: sugar transferase [Bacteroidales bacterium]|nr:sugar transferase [Bacteroidales bacterium]